MSEIGVQAPNSLLLIGDPSGELPTSIKSLVSTTSSCIVVGTLMQQNGPAHVHLLDGVGQDESLPPMLVWDGYLELPSGVMTVKNVYGETYLERNVGTASAHVRVFVNHGNEPDQIAILVGEDARLEA